MSTIFKYITIAIIVILIQGCNQNNITINKLITSNNALHMENNYEEISYLLVQYKQKLDKKNPSSFNKLWQKEITANMIHQTNTVSLYDFKDNYNKYLKHAFNNKSNINNRNDSLIMGIYKLLYSSYGIDNKKYTALSYNIKNLQEFSDILQIIRWKINYKKDLNKNYLFLTWQNNWQIEFLKKTNIKNPNYNLIKNLNSIKNNKESVFNHSDMSFESILSKIIYINNNSIKKLGGEPNDLAINVLKMFVFL